MDIELCIQSVEEAKLAGRVGAKRVELCSALEIGGITPSSGLISRCSDLNGAEVHVLIRPRGGDFNYSSEEVSVMLFDIEKAKKSGASGAVFGILDSNDNLNIESNKTLLELSRSLDLEVTFHRAFDLTPNPKVALEQIINLGFDRLLTSGQKQTAIEGIGLLSELVNQSKNRIQIMAGSGVSAANAAALKEIGIHALHFSSSQKTKSTSLNMGNTYSIDSEKVSSILKLIAR